MEIIVKNLTKIYGRQKAVDEISFSIKGNGITGFLGPNGAGKSTSMKIICGYMSSTSGSVMMNDLEMSIHSKVLKSKIGYLPENNPLYPDMYIREYLAFMAGISKVRDIDNRVKDIIEKVGLSSEKHKKIGELSKGYRQRVGLAQALIHDPEILILDEPTTGLDPNQLVEIRNLIKEVSKDKIIILSTHIMQEVEALCDRVLIINKGKLVADNSMAELKNKNQSLEEIFHELTL